MADVPPPTDPLSYVWYLLGQVAATIGDLTYNLQTVLLQNIQSITAQLSAVTGQIAAGIQNLLGGITQTIVQVVDGVLAGIQQYLGPLLDTLNTIADGLRSFFSNLLSRLETVVLGLWQEITRKVGEALQWLASLAVDIKNGVVALVSAGLDYMRTLLDKVVSTVSMLLGKGLDAISSVAQKVVDTAARGVSDLLSDTRKTIQSTEDLITAGWQNLVSGSESLVDQIKTKLGDVATGFSDAADTVAGALKDLLPEQLGDLTERLFKGLGDIMEPFGDEYQEESRALLEKIFSPHTLKAYTRVELAEWLKWMTGETRWGQAVFRGIVVCLLAVNLYQGIASASAQALQGEFSIEHPWNQLSPLDVVAAWRRGMLSEEEALIAIRWHGYDAEDAQRILLLGQTPPTPHETIAFWRRGIISEEEMLQGLAAAGLAQEWVEPMLSGSEYIPPVQDLITMAVREAFTPDIAERFGQYQDVPEALLTWTEKQGMSPEWARAYWAAHWGLPSVQMGYEMLHRGVITPEELNLLLRAQDVMPWWRDKLIAISYSPLTRVDVRRMHKLGVLSEEQVLRAYKDLGYNETNAQNLTEFTKLLNKGPSDEDVGELGKLSRTSILGFYRDGLLKREQAVQLLKDSGVNDQAAELYVSQVDVDEQEAERKAEAALIVELALAGELTQVQARDKLNALGLGDTEVEKILAQLYRRLAARTKTPTRSEGQQLLEAGIIAQTDYRALLVTLGYSDRWADAFVTLAQAKGQKRG